MIKAKLNDTKVITGKVRFSYLHVFEPQGINGSEPKYSVSLIISKDDKDTVAAVEKAVDNAKTAGISKFGGKIPTSLKTPLRDGDEDRPDDENYANCYFVNASCKTKPGLVYKNGNNIEDELDLYSGCYGLASITFYAFNTNGNKGIACGLNHLMKLEDGESLGGRVSAEKDFEGYIEDEDDMFS
jgi:hypothetical protein